MPIEIRKLSDMPESRRGWLVGQFLPEGDAFNDKNVEIYCKTFKKGVPADELHLHPEGKDYAIVVSGKARLRYADQEVVLEKDDYITIPANTPEQLLEVLEDFTIIGIRYPSVPNNKVLL